MTQDYPKMIYHPEDNNRMTVVESAEAEQDKLEEWGVKSAPVIALKKGDIPGDDKPNETPQQSSDPDKADAPVETVTKKTVARKKATT